MFKKTVVLVVCMAGLLISPLAFAGAHYGADGLKPDKFGHRTGFKGSEEELGAAVARVINDLNPTGAEDLDFTGYEKELGMAVETVIKTLSNRRPYQHEPNDALIKATLTGIQFAKDNDMLEEKINHEVLTQSFLIKRVGKLMEQTGNTDLGLIGMTERTACFYQLVLDYRREGDAIVWKSPYGNVLAQTTRLGQHDMTEEWIHENYTIPLMTQQAELMGMVAEISPWQEDGWITMRLVKPEAVAAN
jgi:hypothetical protein